MHGRIGAGLASRSLRSFWQQPSTAAGQSFRLALGRPIGLVEMVGLLVEDWHDDSTLMRKAEKWDLG